jgi:hypothetical protein
MKNCVNNDYTIKRIEIERDFADDVFKKYRYKRYGIGNCCGSDFDDNVNKKALCDHDDNQLPTYIDSTITSVTYTPPEGVDAEDDPNRPDWVNKLCGMDHDEVQIYFYYDATSLGVQEFIQAYTAAQAWVDNIKQDETTQEADMTNCTNLEQSTIEVYHTTVFGERWLDWGTSAMTGVFQNAGSCGGNGTVDINGANCVTGTAVNVDPDPSRNFGTNDCGSAADSAFPFNVTATNIFWSTLEWAQANGKVLYNGGAAGVNGGAFFPTVNTIGMAPAATAKNILVVCFIDESASPNHHQPYTGVQAAGAAATWNAATDGAGNVTDCWKADYTEFITQRNAFLAITDEHSANFYCYPSKPSNPGASHRPFPLHALGAITSGDQSPYDGTLSVAPANTVTNLTAITTSNPYFAQGYGALDQHGWGINPAELPFTPEVFNADLTEFAEIIECNDSTCFVFKVVNQDGKPIPCYSIILDGGNIGYTDDYGILRYCITDASVNTKHTLQLCHCFTTTGDCSSQYITITLTEECPVDDCPEEPFIACEDPYVPSSGNDLSGCLDPNAPNYCPFCTADCAGVVGGSDWSCCDYCADFSLSFSSTDATDDTTNDGTIDLTVSNGTAPYTYAWTGPGGFTATTEDLTGLAGGVYTVVVTDSSNPVCTETLTVYIDAPPSIVFGCMDAGTTCDQGMDVAFVIDYTSSMGMEIDQVKAGIGSIIAQIQSMVGTSDYKLSLTIFDEYNTDPTKDVPGNHPYSGLAAYTSLPAAQRSVVTQTTPSVEFPAGDFMLHYFTCLEMFGLNNGTTFTTQLNLLNTASFPLGNSNAHSLPEPADIAIDMVGLQDFSGTWRTGVAKYVILMSDALAGGDNNSYDPATTPGVLSTLASNLVAQGIQVIVVGNAAAIQNPSGTYPWRVFADATNGTWDVAATDYSTGTNNALSTLCTPLPAACNYDPLATYDCAGVLGGNDYSCCHYDACTDATATNYDPSATHDCNCDPIGTNLLGWDSCCTYCVYGCTDPLANNYDPNATCEDTCTYDWTCTEATATNDCENMADTGVYGPEEDQLEHISVNYQYTLVNTLQWEIDNYPVSGDPCPGPNGGAMAYITHFGHGTPVIWQTNGGMNPAGYTTWNDFITDLSVLFPSINMSSTYAQVEAAMGNGWEGGYYNMRMEYEYCQCTDGALTTLNSCQVAGAVDASPANPADTSTPGNWSQYLSVNYANQPANLLYFCSEYNYAVNSQDPDQCPCGGIGANGTYVTGFTHSYDDGSGTVITGTSTQTWNSFIADLIAANVSGIYTGMDYVGILSLPQGIQSYFSMAWHYCTCTEAPGCTCVEMTDGTGTYPDQAACEAAANCCGNTCGCLDPAAANYCGSCNADCGDPCTVPAAPSYGDTSCCEYLGCMDPLATNYDPQANIDDGSCEYMWKCVEGEPNVDTCAGKTDLSVDIGTGDCTQLIEYLIDDSGNHNLNINSFKWCYTAANPQSDFCPCGTTGNEYWYQAAFIALYDTVSGNQITDVTWTGLLAQGDITLAGWNVDDTMTFAQIETALVLYNTANESGWEFHCNNAPCTCEGADCDCVEDPNGKFNTKFECESDVENCCGMTCEPCSSSTANTTNPGCCDETASNYDPAATCDDGSCLAETNGCMDCGYIWEALNPPNLCNGVTPAITPGGLNYYPGATVHDSSCIYMSCTDPSATNYNEDCNSYVFTGNNPLGDPYNSASFIDDGCCDNIAPVMTYIPDPGFQAQLNSAGLVPNGWWNSTGTVSGGDWVYTSDINTHTFLNLTNWGVADLTGLQDFVALQTLHCGNSASGGPNTFTDINQFISTLVNLTTLTLPFANVTNLDCVNNIQMKWMNVAAGSLTSLDLTTCVDLLELQCQQNSLTTLDVTNNVNLTMLNCFENNLTSLDVSQNTVLGYLQTSLNSITTLDVSNNTLLTFIDCADNPLTFLDISNNSIVTSIGCHDTQLTTLDLSSITNLSMGGLVSIQGHDNPNLACVNLMNGNNTVLSQNINNFNFTNCPQLLTGSGVAVDSVAYSNSFWLPYFDVGITFNTTDCLVNYTRIPDANFRTTLDNNHSVTWFNNDINSEYVLTSDINTITILALNGPSVADLTGIEDFTALQELYGNSNQLTSADLSNNTALTLLALGANQLTSLDVSGLTSLTTLGCSQNQLTSLDVSTNTALTNLNCDNNQLTSLDISNNTVLTFLHCHVNQLTSLNIKNTNNTNITNFLAATNSLTTITCDDIAYATATWSTPVGVHIDAGVTFVL